MLNTPDKINSRFDIAEKKKKLSLLEDTARETFENETQREKK